MEEGLLEDSKTERVIITKNSESLYEVMRIKNSGKNEIYEGERWNLQGLETNWKRDLMGKP